MFALAVPVVLAELGWMTMGLVDTLMVGPLGPEAIGAVGIGSSLFMGVVHLRHGAAPRPRHAGVAGLRRRPSRRVPPLAAARHRLSLVLALPRSLVLVLGMSVLLAHWGLHPDVLPLAQPYLPDPDVEHRRRCWCMRRSGGISRAWASCGR